MAPAKALSVSILLLCLGANIVSKIVLPHKLRYLENMLNAEVVAKAAKIRQRIEANPNLDQDLDKSWPLLLAKYQADDKKNSINSYSFNNIYGRRIPNL